MCFLCVFADIDECQESTANCSHICNNENGTYSCDCSSGFVVQPDLHNCLGMCNMGIDVLYFMLYAVNIIAKIHQCCLSLSNEGFKVY